jgi:hypothetical protein
VVVGGIPFHQLYLVEVARGLTSGNIKRALRIAPSYNVSAGLLVEWIRKGLDSGSGVIGFDKEGRNMISFYSSPFNIRKADIPHDHNLPFEDIIIIHQSCTETIHWILL